MQKILDRVEKGIETMNNISKKVIKYGVHIFFLVTLIGLSLSVYGTHFLNNNYSLFQNSINLYRISFSILAISIIGGIIIEFMVKGDA